MNRILLPLLLALPATVLAAGPAQPPPTMPSTAPPGGGDVTIDNIGEWCKSVGIGAERMAMVRDEGIPRDRALTEVAGGKPIPDELRGSFETMADTAYQYKDLPPGSLKMLGFSACMMSQIGMLTPENMTRLEKIVKTCRKSIATPQSEFEACVDRNFASMVSDLAAKAP